MKSAIQRHNPLWYRKHPLPRTKEPPHCMLLTFLLFIFVLRENGKEIMRQSTLCVSYT